jgi:GST-like protein
MLELWMWDTSNAQRVQIMLEECALPYRAHRVDLMKDEQRSSQFLALNPVGAVPVLRDPDGPGGQPLTLAQSGAIMLYLADKTGRFLPRDPARKARALQWFMFAVSDCMMATAMIFQNTAIVPDKSPDNVSFFEERLLRYCGVIDAELAGREWLADEVGIADFALYPIVRLRRPLVDKQGGLDALRAWCARMERRPAVAKVYA